MTSIPIRIISLPYIMVGQPYDFSFSSHSKRKKVTQSGVYTLTNTKNQKLYIGSSADIYKRWSYHRTMLRAGNHDISALQEDFTNQEENDFIFTLIEDEATDYYLHEQELINSYRTKNMNSLYNGIMGKPKGHAKPENSGRIAGEDGVMPMIGFRASAPFKTRIEAAARRAQQKPSDWMRSILEQASQESERDFG